MLTAKIFQNGRSQAVRLPREYRFEGSEVIAHKIGDVVMLLPSAQKDSWSTLLASLEMFSDDFMAEVRNDACRQEKEEF